MRMNMRQLLVLSFVVALGGCSSMSDLLSFGQKQPDDEPVAAMATPVPAAAPDDNFCRNVAAQDGARSGLDAESQKRIALQSYAQCQALSGGIVTSR